MSSGNPMGLSEISHFGTFQRVGGKAGGFISKKFFHPSSFRNQEKLWKAQNADERENRKQVELEKRREEERQVEALRKQMYLSGQGKATDLLPSSSPAIEEEAAESSSADKKSDQMSALEEEKRRRAMLKHQGKDGRKAPTHGSSVGKLAASRYPEDVLVLNHQSVWGSWYSMEEKRWGFVCCKVMDRNMECSLSGEADADAAAGQEVGASSSSATSSKKPRIGEDSTGSGAGHVKVADPEGGLQARGTARGHVERSREAGRDDSADDKVKGRSSLLDSRLLQAAERRGEKRKCESDRAEDAKTSDYLADLLLDPSAGR
mmetsp:Transcript_16383/g.22036  ORF Transcript_16383/g.22036 Transcript_16383/m.22036 type:complete len:319 (-) Transcript_16383:109-1065(-)